MTTTTKEDNKRRRASDEEGGCGGTKDHPKSAPPPSKRKRSSTTGSGGPSREVRVKVVKPAKASASAQAPAALAPFVGYLAHGRLGAAAKAAQTIGGGGGSSSRPSSVSDDPDGAKAASKVHFDVYEAPKRAPVYVAQLAGPPRRTDEQQHGDDDAAAAAATTPRLLLVGRTDGAEQAGASAAGWYAVGVYSRSKGTLTLARAQDGRLGRVEPVLPEGVAAALAAKQRADDEAALAALAAAAQQRETDRERSKRLVDAFGSTRRKRQLQAREEGAVRSDRLLEGGAGVQAALARVNAAAAGEGATRDAVLARAAAHRNVPPHDPSATRAHEAYRVRAFFTPAFWDALNAGQLMAAAEDPEQMAKLRERGLVPGYVLSRCEALLRPTAATGSGSKGAAGGGAASAAADPAAASARRWRAKLLAAVAALLTLHAGRASVRVPAVPGGLDDAAKRLRMCARGEALEAVLDALYVPAGRVEGEDPSMAAAAAAAAEQAAAVKLEQEQAAAAGGGGTGAGAVGDAPQTTTTTTTTSQKPPPRAPRPAADVFVRDDRQKALALAYALVIALDAEGWRLSPEAFEALRAELKVPARDLALRFRELGCDAVSSPTAGGTAAYSVSLLQKMVAGGEKEGEAGPRTLEAAFPKAKRPATQRGR
jgi:hypothetical protein